MTRFFSRFYLFCVATFFSVAGLSATDYWLNQDVGAVGVAGTASTDGSTFTVQGSGAAIGGTADGFQYVDQWLLGDGQIVARVVSIGNTNAASKAGVMIRESLANNSRHASMVVTPTSGILFQRRLATGGATTTTTKTGFAAPYWVKVARAGNIVTGSISPDGNTWTQVGSETMAFSGNLYVGLVVCATKNTALDTGVFDHVTVTGGSPVDADGDGMPDAWELQYFGNLNQTANGDYDRDGVTNLQEFINGTDPTTNNGGGGETPASLVPPSWPLYVFKDAEGPYTPSGYLGDTSSLTFSDTDVTAPVGQGYFSTKIIYSGAGTNGYAGIYWQHPANNFGAADGGLNLTGAKKLKFMARGLKGNERIKFILGGINDPSQPFYDSFRVEDEVILTSSWKSYEIDLTGKDLRRVIGGFSFIATHANNPTGATFFLDNIYYDDGSTPPSFPPLRTPQAWPFYVYRDLEGPHRPTGFFGDASALTFNDQDFAAPGEGFNDIRIDYDAANSPNGFAGVYWQNPGGNFGTITNGGYNLTGATNISFMAKSSVAGTKVQFIIGGIPGTWQTSFRFGDSLRVTPTAVTSLTTAWKTYNISLQGLDLSRVVGGFSFVITKANNPTGGTIFLDNIKYDNGTVPPTPPSAPAPAAFPAYVYRDSSGPYIPSGFIGDTTDLAFSDTDFAAPGEGIQNVKVQYTPSGPLGFAGVFWQNPAGNFGSASNGGFNMTGAKNLRFMAKANANGVKATVGAGGSVTTVDGAFADTFKVQSVLNLTTNWQSFAISLTGKNLSRVITGFNFTMTQTDNPSGATLYLDNIYYDNGVTPPARPASPKPAASAWPIYVYKDSSPTYIPSGYFGDATSLTLSNDENNPGEGFQSVRVDYNAAVSTNGFAGVYWQNPANNFGTVTNGGLNLTGGKKLKFMARGGTANVKVQFIGGGIVGANANPSYGDTYKAVTQVLTLSNTWQSYEIDLTGKDLTHVIGGFAFVVVKSDNPSGATFYLDNIRYDNGTTPPPPPPAPNGTLPLYIYKDAHDKYIPSGFIGDTGSLTLNDQDTTNPGQGFKDIKITYSGAGSNGVAGIYWQNPANNFGTVTNGGFNLTGAKKVKFMARGNAGGEKIKFQAGGVSGQNGGNGDTFLVTSPLITLTTSWQTFELDLTGKDLSRVISGFVFTATKADNPSGATFYLDNIVYDDGSTPPPPPPPAPSASLPLYVYKDSHDKYVPSGFIGDTASLTINDQDLTNPGQGFADIKITYSGVGSNAFAGIFWQNPANNFGTASNGGFNLTGALKIKFMARGNVGGEKITFQAGGVPGQNGGAGDTFLVNTPLITLTTSWQNYEIDLSGRDLTRVITGFAFVATKANNATGATFYLDNIVYDDGSTPPSQPPAPAPSGWPVVIYKDALDQYIPSGFIGDSGDLTLLLDDTSNPGQGFQSMKVSYTAAGSSSNNFAGIFWQNPAGNFGQTNGGFNLTGAKTLQFMARGKVGGEKIQFLAGGVSGVYSDTFKVVGPVVTLTTAWQSFSFDLTGKDMSRVITGFAFVATKANNPSGAVFYLDNVRYENGSTPPPPPPPAPTATLPLAVYKDVHDKYLPTGWDGDLNDLTFTDTDGSNPGEGFQSIKINYSAATQNGEGFAGIFWQNPANNFGQVTNGGFNLTGAKKIKFMARGAVGGEKVRFQAGGVSGTNGGAGDTFKVVGPVLTLTTSWQNFELDLTGKDLSRVISAFVMIIAKSDNPNGAAFYLDNIIYDDGSTPPPPSAL